MIRKTKTTLLAAVTLAGALALTGCAGSDSGNTDADVPGASATRTPSETPTATKTAEATKDLSFEDGDNLGTDKLPAWSVQVSGLKGWELTATNPTEGSSTYTKASDGSTVTLVQQQVTDLKTDGGDQAATESLFSAAGLPVERLEKQLLPTYDGGTAEFLSVAGTSDGGYIATVARAFAQPKVALSVTLKSKDEASLKTDLHEVLINSQVVLS